MNIFANPPRIRTGRKAGIAALLLLITALLGACATTGADVAWRGQYDLAVGTATSFKR